MNGAKIGVLEERNEVGFGCLLQCQDGCALEAEIFLEILRNLADQSLEGQFANQVVSALLYRRISRRATVPGR